MNYNNGSIINQLQIFIFSIIIISHWKKKFNKFIKDIKVTIINDENTQNYTNSVKFIK